MKPILTLIGITISWLLNAQVSTYPYSQDFEDPFTQGHSVYFLPNWWGNYVAVDSMGQYDGFAQTGTHSLFMTPEGEEFKTIAQVELDLTSQFNNIAEFWVASRKNGSPEDQKRVKLNVAISTDGGMTFPFVTRIGSHEGFLNEDTPFEKFLFVFPPTTNDQSQVVLRFTGKSGGGPHLPGTLLIDNVLISQSEEDIFPPYIVGEELSISSTNSFTVPFSEPLQIDSALLLSHYNFLWPVEEDGTPIIGEGPLPGIANIALNSEGTSVTFTLDPPLSIGETYALEMYKITDLHENAADTLLIDAIVYNIPKPGAVVFSEVLFADPSPSFPKEKLQYIELYNPTTEVVPLGGLRIKGAVSAHNLPNVKLQPGEYWVATRNAESYYATFGKTAWEWKGSWIEYDSEEGELIEPQSLYIQTTDRHSGQLVDSIGFDFNDPNWLALKKLGYSIEVCNKLTDNVNVANWSLADDSQAPFTYTFDGYSYEIHATPEGSCHGSFVPVIDLGADGNYCGVTELSLDAGNEGSTYLWSTGEDTQAITITESGAYSVIVNNGSGVSTGEIVISLVPAVIALIEPMPSANCALNELQFMTNTPDAVTWLWSFGDGKTSLQENPTHTYQSGGNYEVKLTVFNGFGCADTAKTSVEIISNDVSFKTPSLLCANKSIEFIDETLNGMQWSWQFGDGNSATTQNPIHNYSHEGAYLVSLTVTNTSGCTATKSKEVTVMSNEINLAFPEGALCTYMDVPFSDTSPLTFQRMWDFGDGSGSTMQNTTHTYTHPGDYTVQLSVTSTNGCTNAISKSITVGICVGIENPLDEQGASLYPNPSSGTISLKLNWGDPSAVHVMILNPKGEVVFNKDYIEHSGVYQLDVSMLPEGVYIVRAQQGNRLINKKLVIRSNTN